MPRQARLDAPGTPHHVILRGMEHGQMVTAREDRESFLARLVLSLAEAGPDHSSAGFAPPYWTCQVVDRW